MLPALEHFDVVVGVDVHIPVPLPPAVPCPVPTPFIGIFFNPDDYPSMKHASRVASVLSSAWEDHGPRHRGQIARWTANRPSATFSTRPF
jgi:hypothetical protein